MNFRFLEEAILEVEEVISYSRTHFDKGDEMNLAISKAVRLIVDDPQRFSKRTGGFGTYKLPGVPYRLFFRIDEASSTIVFHAFAHSSRRPGYWKSRN